MRSSSRYLETSVTSVGESSRPSDVGRSHQERGFVSSDCVASRRPKRGARTSRMTDSDCSSSLAERRSSSSGSDPDRDSTAGSTESGDADGGKALRCRGVELSCGSPPRHMGSRVATGSAPDSPSEHFRPGSVPGPNPRLRRAGRVAPYQSQLTRPSSLATRTPVPGANRGLLDPYGRGRSTSS